MKSIFNNKKPNGIFYQGIKYGGISEKPQLLYRGIDFKRPVKMTCSAGSDYTSGYPVTFSFLQDQFKLYNIRTFEQYNYLPNHKFIYYNVTPIETNALRLIYDGDGLFHLEGDLSSLSTYSSGKTAASKGISLVDENGELMLANVSSLIKATVSSTSTSVNFTENTNTYETITDSKFKRIFDISLPLNLKTMATDYKHERAVVSSISFGVETFFINPAYIIL